MTAYVNEASTLTVRAKFFSITGDLTAPTTARYLIRDLTNNRVVKDWTTLLPAATIDIEIVASDNDLYTQARQQRRFEKRVVTVQADTGEARQRTNEIEYWIRNLAGITND
jgi:hypothetical protein